MKKYLLIVFCAVIMFAVTGCGSKNQVVCSGTMTEGDEEVKVELTADFDNDDKLTTVTMSEDLGDEDKANQVCAMYNAFASQMPEGVSVSCSGSKIIIKGFEKMDDDEEESVVGKTKEEFKKAMEEESEGAITCK